MEQTCIHPMDYQNQKMTLKTGLTILMDSYISLTLTPPILNPSHILYQSHLIFTVTLILLMQSTVVQVVQGT